VATLNLTDSLPFWRDIPCHEAMHAMIVAGQERPESLLENYCSRLGTLLERQYTGLALLAAKQEADAAAKRAEQAMLAAQAADLAKTKFLANMAHELRTPLNAIIGFSEIIKLDNIQARERYPQYAEYIHDAGILLLSIINGLLDLARIEAGKVDLEEQLVGVGELIHSAVRTIDPIAQKKSIQIKCELSHSTTVIHVDQMKIRQIMLNILSNSIKFAEPDGEISIESLINSNRDLIISIKDNGIGIAPENINRVLKPFEQVADHLTKENEGA
jgi:signal transduction histidine kinase